MPGLPEPDMNRTQLLGEPLKKLCILIKTTCWPNLTRAINVDNKALTSIDIKVPGPDPRPRIYVPCKAFEQFDHYSKLAAAHPELRLEVRSLPHTKLSPSYIKSLNQKPGLLALAVEHITKEDGTSQLVPLPYVVPGGRFNELYGWDTYFITLGLLVDGFTDLGISMLKHFCFCIQYYGKIFNANRTYSLGRAQPPFLTSMGLAVCRSLDRKDSKTIELVRMTLLAAIKEYYTVWMTEPHLDTRTGLSRYYGEGLGIPPEVEPHHFDAEIAPHAAKRNMTIADFCEAYDNGTIKDVALDEYLAHDRACRESGRDTTYRFNGRAANLVTVDLNSCLHKYEIDIAHMLDSYFGGSLEITSEWLVPGQAASEVTSTWVGRAQKRREVMTQYFWCSEAGLFFDYDSVTGERMSYESATTLWPLWARVASPTQAEAVVQHALPKLEVYGGLTASTEVSRGPLSDSRPPRQWDYPYGWAPHQMLAWDGLRNYGYDSDAERLIYRWLTMVVKTFSEHNGVIVEKYDVTSRDKSHVVEAEYGNQGTDFDSEVQTGFAWTNASIIYGADMLKALRSAA